MIHVTLKDGRFEILRDTNELQQLIADEMGRDVSLEIEKLIDEANYTKQRLNTDVDAYESELEALNTLCGDALDKIDKSIQYVEGAKRLDRTAIIKCLKDLKRLIAFNG